MSHINGPAPGFMNRPDHAINISPSDSRWIAQQNGVVLADSQKALILQEASYNAVTYFPLADVSVGALVPTTSKTTCPYKGEASYFASAASEGRQDVAWTYPKTYDEVSAIAGYVAFYADRVCVSES